LIANVHKANINAIDYVKLLGTELLITCGQDGFLKFFHFENGNYVLKDSLTVNTNQSICSLAKWKNL